MSVICQTFVQNAWRSDLCSNCFKCLAEHSESRHSNDRMTTPRYMPQATSLYQSRGISSTLKWRLSEPIYERIARRDFGSQTPSKANQEPDNNNRGILIKNAASPEKKLRSRPSVDFASEEALIIGYGGNDYDSDQSTWEMASDDESIDLDLLDDTDEDRTISRLTKNNTEFNSSNKNLQEPQKEKEEKLNCINNNANNVSTKTTPKALTCVTYNDIQSQKKFNQYYFSTNIEPLKSYLHNSNETPKSTKVDNAQKDNCRNLLSNDFTPLNTRTYSFVSELNKHGSEHSSDSDYSTCRLTAGDSTDSESFQDAEEPRILPCSSFLHGSFPRKLQQQPSMNSLDSDKKYDAGSSTSGDVSNLSDDSDTIETSERTFKSRTTRITKVASGDTKRQLENNSPPTSPSNDPNRNEKIYVTKSDVTTATTKASNSPITKTLSPPNKQTDSPKPSVKRENETVPTDAQLNSRLQSDSKPIHKQTGPSPNPNPPVEVNLRNIIAVNDTVANPKETRKTSPQMTPNETKSSPPRTTKSGDGPQKSVRKSAPVKDQKVCDTPTLHEQPISTPKAIDKSPSDEDEASPEAINNRQSKLAALALELELARRDSEMKSGKAPPPSIPPPPPEVKANKSSPRTTNPSTNYPTIKKGSGISCTSRLTSLPDVLQESSTPNKLKKNRFSLKKLLKRNKDSSTFAPANKEVNPKAWKKQTFDRNRLSLEIVHPMDLSPPTSGDSTPTEEGQYTVSSHPGRGALRGGYSRARSLSALPQLTGEYHEPTLLECRQVDTMPTRKAGTVAERKKNRPSLVRTPSCSALPNRPSVSVQDRTPPPKPPPPPKCMQPPPPPPPPHQARKPTTCSPARPPPPKIPETKSRIQSGDSSKTDQRDLATLDKEYANLGDIRSLMTPKKPERPSAVSVSRDSSDGSKRPPDHLYEIQQEEEDHYTYLDDMAEVKSPQSHDAVSKETQPSPKTSNSARGRPWLDLQTSYAAIAAANYESLAEIITTSMAEGAECFQNGGKSLRWKDFALDEEEPQTMAGNRSIYSATYKHKGNKTLLMVTPKQLQSSPQNTRNLVRYPVLASFSDYAPKLSTPEEWATIYVLHPSRIFSIHEFSQQTSTSTTEQHLHLRNSCFVLLQLIHTLKSLQAEGIEDVHCDLLRLLLVTTSEDKPPVFVLFPEDKTHLVSSDNRKTLCQATLATMFHFLKIGGAGDLESCLVNGERLSEPVAHTFRAIAKVLSEEKASSLSQAKGFLEYMLWGPVDVRVSNATDVMDSVLQRWLDLQRAQMVKSTISQMQQKTHLHVYEEYQLVFLLQASVKSLKSVISKL